MQGRLLTALLVALTVTQVVTLAPVTAVAATSRPARTTASRPKPVATLGPSAPPVSRPARTRAPQPAHAPASGFGRPAAPLPPGTMTPRSARAAPLSRPRPSRFRPVAVTRVGGPCWRVRTPGGRTIVLDPCLPWGGRLGRPNSVDLVAVGRSCSLPAWAIGRRRAGLLRVFRGVDPRSGRAVARELRPWSGVRLRSLRPSSSATTRPSAAGPSGAALLLEAGGVRVLHLGSEGRPPHGWTTTSREPIDVLMIPLPGDDRDPADPIRRTIRLLDPRMAVLPMHYSKRPLRLRDPINRVLGGNRFSMGVLRGRSVMFERRTVPRRFIVLELLPSGSSGGK